MSKKIGIGHVKTSSWHYQLVVCFFGSRAWHSKIFMYYGIMVPYSLLATFVMLMMIAVCYAIAFFLGNWPMRHDDGSLFYPHGKLPNGKNWPLYLQPWTISIAISFIVLAEKLPKVFWIIVTVLATIILLAASLY
jgi:hypothetical protein